MRIGKEQLATVEAHGRAAYPAEACGLLLGRTADDGVREALRVRPARNLDAERARDRYLLDPADRLAAEREAAADGLAVVGVYHSHPDHDAYFSRTDLERSEEYQWGEPWVPPAYTYLVTSVRGGEAGATRAFEVASGAAREVDLVVHPPQRSSA